VATPTVIVCQKTLVSCFVLAIARIEIRDFSASGVNYDRHIISPMCTPVSSAQQSSCKITDLVVIKYNRMLIDITMC
jgi:hypothetical protein